MLGRSRSRTVTWNRRTTIPECRVVRRTQAMLPRRSLQVQTAMTARLVLWDR